MASLTICLPRKEELKRRLVKLISAEEIEREKAFYLHGLMFFTEEHMREADAEKLIVFLTMTMGSNLTAETQAQGQPINIESVIDAIVGESKETGNILKNHFSGLAERYRCTR